MPLTGRFDKVAPGSYFNDMRAVGLKVLKNKLSEYVRLAAGGETILITDHDKVVAELRAPGGGQSAEVADAVLAELVRKGLMTPARNRQSQLPPRKPVMTLKQLLKELDEDRADRW